MDTYNGLPALADNDPASLIGQASRELRAALVGTTGSAPGNVGTPWAPLTLLNGWTNAQGVAAWRRFGPLVMLYGEIIGSATGQASPLFVLPIEASPRNRFRNPWGWGASTGYYAIEADGTFWSSVPRTSSPGLSLANIVYAAV